MHHHQDMAEKAQSQNNTFWLRYEDLIGKINCICKSAGFAAHKPHSDSWRALLCQASQYYPTQKHRMH
jgi:hypothetical protein